MTIVLVAPTDRAPTPVPSKEVFTFVRASTVIGAAFVDVDASGAGWIRRRPLPAATKIVAEVSIVLVAIIALLTS